MYVHAGPVCAACAADASGRREATVCLVGFSDCFNRVAVARRLESWLPFEAGPLARVSQCHTGPQSESMGDEVAVKSNPEAQ